MFLAKLTLVLTFILPGWPEVSATRATQSKTPLPRDGTITLQRFRGAFGGGVDYRITINSDGTVIFKRFRDYLVPDAKEPDPIRTKITGDKLAQLVAEFDRINFFSLKDHYADREDGCPSVWTDQGGAVTSLTINGKTKRIDHYYGCRQGPNGPIYPADLTDLERKIDEIVGTKQWLK